jgi:hypothetical protein
MIHNSNKNINYNEISHNFIQYYYNLIDSHNTDISKLYKNYSCMNFCKQEYTGDTIFLKYLEIYKNCIKHTIETISAIPDGNRRINILVTGVVCINNINYKFTQFFHLCLLDDNRYWIKSTIFSLV